MITSGSTQDDLEADEAVAILKVYWPIAQRVTTATSAWGSCHDHTPTYAAMRACLDVTMVHVRHAAAEVPREKTARLHCGKEIEEAHHQYIESQVAHLTRMVDWVQRNAEVLEPRMRDRALADVWPEIPEYPIDMSSGFAQISGVQRTKSLFQCGPSDNVAVINKVAASLGLGPEKPGNLLRVRSSQRAITG